MKLSEVSVFLCIWSYSFVYICRGEDVYLDPDLRKAIADSFEKDGGLGAKKLEVSQDSTETKTDEVKIEQKEKKPGQSVKENDNIIIVENDNMLRFGQKLQDIQESQGEKPKKTIIEVEKATNSNVDQKVDDSFQGQPKESKETIVEIEKASESNVDQKADDSRRQKSKKHIDIKKYRLLRKEVPDGRAYGVYDGLVPAKYQVLVNRYLKHSHEAWLFNNYDADNFNNQRTHDNSPWINDQDPLAFAETRLCKRLLAAVVDTAQNKEIYYPYRVFGKIIRRGDHTHVSADSTDEGEYSVMLFVNEFWRKNYYGELYLYDKHREIVGGATHKPARVVVWESTILRLNRPPAVSFLQGQILFQVQFTKNKEKMMEGHQKWKSYQEKRKKAYEDWYLPDYKLPNGELFVAPDPSKHKIFEYTTQTDGRKIFVFDNLFPKELLDHLRSFVLKYGSYFYDDSIDSDSDNVQWIAGFLLKPYLQSPYWKVVKKVATFASGNPNLFPYDVSINLVRNADHTRIHGDVSYYGEEEFTCLVYLNPNWTKNDYGETTFFEKNSDDTEIVAQVRPRYGRTVIFDGNIPHSARPPSFNFSGARLTFVTKLHRNEYTGRKKNFQEEMRHFNGYLSSLSELEILGKRSGEAYARRQLQELREMKEKLSFRPESETSDPDRQNLAEDDEEEEEEENGQEERGNSHDNLDEEQSQRPEEEDRDHKSAFEFIDPEVMQDLPEESVQLYSQLEGVTEESENGIAKLLDVHEQMRGLYDDISEEFATKLIKVM